MSSLVMISTAMAALDGGCSSGIKKQQPIVSFDFNNLGMFSICTSSGRAETGTFAILGT
jgi:hypothetical protein